MKTENTVSKRQNIRTNNLHLQQFWHSTNPGRIHDHQIEEALPGYLTYIGTVTPMISCLKYELNLKKTKVNIF